MSLLRRWALARLRRQLAEGRRDLTAAELAASAVVISPHFDDETLGCGGTMLRKAAAGARVSLCFMTDGSTSHAGLMPAEELAARRAAEGRAAAAVLGVAPDDVHLLGFPETALAGHEAEATARLTQLLRERRPAQVFLPARSEPLLFSEDHRATARAAWAAAREVLPDATVFEYPVWIWYHWPAVALSVRERGSAGTILRLSREFGCGRHLVAEFRDRVAIAEVLDAKRAALAAHATQTTRMGRGEEWQTLEDVAGGTFLASFFQPFELFRRTSG